jgi:hypothetical protein
MNPIKFKIDSFWLMVILAAIIKLAIHMVVAGNYELHRDALLYISQSDHLAWGYWSVPPLTAFLTRIFREIFGNSFYAIRLLPALTGVITIFIIGDSVRILGGKKPALIIALLSFVCSTAYLRSNALLQPVSLDQMFWLLGFYFILRLTVTGDTRNWIWLGISIGFGFLTKYSIVFLVAAIFVAFLITPQRKLLWSRNLVYGILAGLVIISPNIYWQYQHNWVVLYHMELLRKYHLVNVGYVEFLLGLILMNLPGVVTWMTGLGVTFLNRDFRRLHVIGLTWVAALVIILWLHGKAYYTLGMFTILFAIGGVALEKFLWDKRRWVYVLNIIYIPLILYPVIPIALPVFKMEKLRKYCDGLKEIGIYSPVRWEDGKIYDIPQDYSDMTGWKELESIVARTYNSLDEQQKKITLLYAENYGQAGAIHFYGRKDGLPEPVSFHESFIFWAPDSIPGKDYLIYVNDDTTDIVKYFRKVIKTGEVNDPYFREGHLPVWLCSDPYDPKHKFYVDVVKPLKQMFIRGYR